MPLDLVSGYSLQSYNPKKERKKERRKYVFCHTEERDDASSSGHRNLIMIKVLPFIGNKKFIVKQVSTL